VPNALLVVAKITPLSIGNYTATIKTYNDAIPGLVQTRAAAGKHVLLADMNTGFTSAMLSSDGVHPNPASCCPSFATLPRTISYPATGSTS
jgi:hypothetical protein